MIYLILEYGLVEIKNVSIHLKSFSRVRLVTFFLSKKKSSIHKADMTTDIIEELKFLSSE